MANLSVEWTDEITLLEVTMALPSNPGLISGIEIDRDWAVITRGDQPIEPDGFALSSLYNDRGRRLLASSSPAE